MTPVESLKENVGRLKRSEKKYVTNLLKLPKPASYESAV